MSPTRVRGYILRNKQLESNMYINRKTWIRCLKGTLVIHFVLTIFIIKYLDTIVNDVLFPTEFNPLDFPMDKLATKHFSRWGFSAMPMCDGNVIGFNHEMVLLKHVTVHRNTG